MIKKCKNCEKEFHTNKSSKQHCSYECFSEYRKKPEILNDIIKKRKQTNLQKYGVDNPAKCEKVKEKTKKTCLERYGVISPTLNADVYQKQIDTNLQKYGVENPIQCSAIKEKYKQTLFKKYGVEIPLKNDEIKKRLKETNIKKYGVDNPSKCKEVKEKIKKTCLERYGVEYPMLCDATKEKLQRTIFKNHYNNIILNSSKFVDVNPLFLENEYNGNISYKTKYPFKCKRCNLEFLSTLCSGTIPRCPVCYPITLSNSECELKSFIKSIFKNDVVLENNRDILNGLELDVYIPSLKIAIEFNGLYWHSEFSGKKNKVYHLNKTVQCNSQNVKLIQIFEDEWLYKQEIVKNRLKHIFGKNNDKIYARNCEIKEIDFKSSSIFLEKYHLQGSDKTSIRFGAYYNENLVAVMTFGKLRTALGNKNADEGEYEMIRFCVGDKNVVGVASKLLSKFIKKYNPRKIISYADKRWNNISTFYTKLGFKLVRNTPPNYWYFKLGNDIRYHRFNFRKDQLSKKLEKFDPKLTEWENMKLNGYDRIWDCGNLKYEFMKNDVYTL